MLSVSGLRAGYGAFQVLHNVQIEVPHGEVRAVIGGNGQGKTTLLKTVSGILRPSSGTIRWAGEDIQGLPAYKVVERGISFVMQGRQLFLSLTLIENLELGGFLIPTKHKLAERLDNVYRLFPWMKSRSSQKASTLSGGEQQMLAIARALMLEPKLLLMDEPSLGLAPFILDEVFDLIRKLKGLGVSVLLVEQAVGRALEVADWVYVIASGTIVESCPPGVLRDEGKLRSVYFGGTLDTRGGE